MPINVGGIEIALTAKVDQFNKAMEKSGKQILDFATKTDKAWQKIQRLGTTLGIIGAGIIFTTKKMVEQAAFLTGDTRLEELMNNLNSLWDELSLTIAEVALPIFVQLASVIETLVGGFLSLDQDTQRLIITIGLVSGVFFIFGGAITNVIGLLKEVGALALSLKLKFGVVGLLGGVLGLAFAFLFLESSMENIDFFEKDPLLGFIVSLAVTGAKIIKFGLDIIGFFLALEFKIIQFGNEISLKLKMAFINAFEVIAIEVGKIFTGIINFVIDKLNGLVEKVNIVSRALGRGNVLEPLKHVGGDDFTQGVSILAVEARREAFKKFNESTEFNTAAIESAETMGDRWMTAFNERLDILRIDQGLLPKGGVTSPNVTIPEAQVGGGVTNNFEFNAPVLGMDQLDKFFKESTGQSFSEYTYGTYEGTQ